MCKENKGKEECEEFHKKGVLKRNNLKEYKKGKGVYERHVSYIVRGFYCKQR